MIGTGRRAGVAERFPLTFTGWCNRIDTITMTEYGDCRDYASEGVIRDLMNLGRTPHEARDNPIKQALTSFWYEPIEMIAPVVCEAPDPGIKTFLDLPMITGRMGTHRTPR